MAKAFEIIDSQPTSLGEITLRRRIVHRAGVDVDVYEVKLNDEFLMSSLFHAAEDALANLGLASFTSRELTVLVGGLGLGYTARAALSHPGVSSVVVIEALRPVIDWHQEGKIPLGHGLSSDVRCRYICDDFFALARTSPEEGFDRDQPGRRFDAILLDIDHSPAKVLNTSHRDFYGPEGLQRLKHRLNDGGVFALWSDDPPDETFMRNLEGAFRSVSSEVVSFPSLMPGEQSTNTVYVASKPR